MADETLEQLLIERAPAPKWRAEGIRPMGRSGYMAPEEEERLTDLASAFTGGLNKMGGLARRIAPKRAAMELVDLLLGRSKRVPAPAPMTEQEVAVKALQLSRTGAVPPPATKLAVKAVKNRPDQTMQGTMNIRRDPTVDAEFKKRQKFVKNVGGTLPAEKTKYIDTAPRWTKPPKPKKQSKPRPVYNSATTTRELAKSTVNRAHDLVKTTENPTKIRVMSLSEMRNLLEGPRKAVKAGMLTQQEAAAILQRNKQKLDDYLQQLRQLDQDNYNRQLEMRAKLQGIE